MARRCVSRTGPARSWGRSGSRARFRHPASEDGFTIIESTFALVLIFAVLLGLLHTMVSASRGLVTSRQRNLAVGLANQVLEQARGASYSLVGLDTGDTTIGTDSAIVSGQYGGESLAYASPPAQALWSPHTFSQVVSNTTFTTKVYVTTVTPSSGGGDPYKRVTALIDWSGATSQYATSVVKSQVKVQSFVFNAQLPADPLLEGLATTNGGFVTLSGTIDNLAISDATFTLPKANSDLSAQLIRTARGQAQTSSADLTADLSLQASGTGVVTGLSATVPSVKVTSAADNDAGTSLPESSEASSTDAGGSVGRVNTVDLVKGASTSLYSKSTAKSTTAFGDNDSLPYTASDASGPASFTVPFAISGILGSTSIGSLLTTGATHVNTVIDRDDSGTERKVSSQATVAHPATTVLSLLSSGLTIIPASGLPFSGLVKIGATGDVVASANAGNAVANPAVTGGSFEVCLLDTISPPLVAQGTCPVGYERLVVTPGTAGTLSTGASLLVNGKGVTLTAIATSGTKSVPSPTMSGSDIQRAEAALLNWFRVSATIVIAGGTNLTMDLTYGSLEARSRYCLPSDAACIAAIL